MDYQNIHLTARDCYAPYGTPAEDVLVHPLLFAQRLVEVRASRQQDPIQRQAELAAVMVFRGTPGSAEQRPSTVSPKLSARSGRGTPA